MSAHDSNKDESVVNDFGLEWSKFQQGKEISPELLDIFENQYFKIFPWDSLPEDVVAADIGCGSGRWGSFVSERISKLHLVDASSAALDVARKNLAEKANVEFHLASVDELPFEDGSLDFVYSLGVLHHVPNTAEAIKSVARKIKPGGMLLLYLYYAFDNRPAWYRSVWKFTELFRSRISRMSPGAKAFTCDLIATFVYWPLARFSGLVNKLGLNNQKIPLNAYSALSFYTMRTDALDRFGTRLEQRFTRDEITQMMKNAGLENIEFSDSIPFWVALGRKL